MIEKTIQKSECLLGVREACERLERPVALVVDPDLAGGPEAYQVEDDRGGTGLLRVRAGSQRGLMYALLDIGDRLRRDRFVPAMALRSYHRWLPFSLGQGYGQQGYSFNEHHTNWWWYDLDYWRGFFREMAQARLNMLALWNVHPFPALIDYEQFPESNAFDPQRRAHNIETFRAILDLAEQYGVEVSVLMYNIHVADGFARKHGGRLIPHNGWVASDTPLVREYTAYCVGRLFETYPKLSGLMTTFEISKDAYDFAAHAILDAMQPFERAWLHFRLWGQHFPDEVQKLIDKLPNRVTLWHKAAEEIIATPQVDQPRLRFWLDNTHGAPMANLVGPSNVTGINFLGRQFVDRSFIHRQVQKLCELGSSGIGLTCGDDNQWIIPGELAEHQPALRKWHAGAWLMRYLVGRAAYDLDSGYDRLKDDFARRAELESEDAQSLLEQAGLASRAGTVYWRYRSIYHGCHRHDPGFHKTAGSYSQGTQAFPQGVFRISGPFALPAHDWGQPPWDYVRASQDDAVLRRLLQEADLAESLAADPKQPIPAGGNLTAAAVRDYAELNRVQARYEAALMRTTCWAHSAAMAPTQAQAVERLDRARKHGRETLLRACRLGKICRALPIVPTSQRADLATPLRVGETWLANLDQDLKMVEQAQRWAERAGSKEFSTASAYWRALNLTFDLNRLAPSRCVHLPQESRGQLRELLFQVRTLLEQACEYDPTVPRHWMETVTDDLRRLESPTLELGQWLDMSWRAMEFVSYSRLPELLVAPARSYPQRQLPRHVQSPPQFHISVKDAAWHIELRNLPDPLPKAPLYLAWSDGEDFVRLVKADLNNSQFEVENYELVRPSAARPLLDQWAGMPPRVKVTSAKGRFTIDVEGPLLPRAAQDRYVRGFNIGFGGYLNEGGPTWRGHHGDERLFRDPTACGQLPPSLGILQQKQ